MASVTVPSAWCKMALVTRSLASSTAMSASIETSQAARTART